MDKDLKVQETKVNQLKEKLTQEETLAKQRTQLIKDQSSFDEMTLSLEQENLNKEELLVLEQMLNKGSLIHEAYTKTNLKVNENQKSLQKLEEESKTAHAQSESINLNFDKGVELESHFIQREQDLKSLKDQLELFTQSKTLKAEITEIIKKNQTLHATLEKANVDHATVQKQISQIESLKLENTRLSESISKDQLELQTQTQKEKDLLHLDSIYKKYEKELKTLQTTQTHVQTQTLKYTELDKNYQTQYHHFLNNMAGILAENLNENVACMVCGSTEHPSLAHKQEGVLSQSELDALKKDLDKEHLKLQSHHNDLTKTQTQVNAYLSDLGEDFEIIILQDLLTQQTKIIDELETLIKTNKGLFDKNKVHIETEAKLKTEETQHLNLIEKTKLSIVSLNEKFKQKVDELDKVKNQLGENTLESVNDRIEKETEALSVDRQFVKDAQKNKETHLILLETLKTKTESLTHQVQEDLKDQETKTSQWNEFLVSIKLDSETQYLELLVPQAIYDQRKLANTKFFETYESLKQSIKTLNHSLKEYKPIDKEAVTLEYNTLYKLYSENLQQSVQIKEQIKMIQNTQVKHESLLQSIAKRQEALAYIKELNDLSNGKLSGKDKVSLELYVQSAYFEHIITAANIRFQKMTHQQFEFFRATEAANKGSKSGLDLEVLDHYSGEKRSVASLSGGESFMASLSLALGLSDVIKTFSGGVQVEALFIDEGFGSLDETSLNQAIHVLGDLQHQDQLVGIISHVESLKQSIDQQVRVKKTQKGSFVEIVVN